MERLRRRLPDQQRRRRHRALRPGRQSLGVLTALGDGSRRAHHAVPRVCRRVHIGGSDRLLQPLCVPVRELSRLSQARRVVRRLLRHVQHVQPCGHGVPRRQDLCLRPDQDAGRYGGDPAVLRPKQQLRWAVGLKRRRHHATAGRLTQLRPGLGRQRQPARSLEVPRRLDHSGQYRLHRTDHHGDRRLHRGVWRRNLHPTGGYEPAARQPRRQTDGPRRVPQLRGPRSHRG